MGRITPLKKTQIFYCILALLVSASAQARVDNFVLLDQHGAAHELYYLSNKPAIVLTAYHSGAKEGLDQAMALLQVRQAFSAQGVEVYLIDSHPQDNRALLQQQKLPIDIPVLMDETQLISRQLGITTVGETLVISPNTWEVVYRGPIGDALTQQLNKVVAGSAEGVKVAMPASASSLVFAKGSPVASYKDDIAPMLQEKCVECHREGGIGPWAMNSYQMIQGFAPMIREVVLTKRMPPWHADPHINQFNDDISLSVDQQRTLVNWINAGAPRGEGADPLLKTKKIDEQWVLGEPDLIIDLPSFDVPATGSVDYQFFETVNPLDKDVWVKAVHIIPGERAVVHHAISTFGEPDDPSRPIKPAEGGNEGSALLQQQLMTFVPGNEYYVYPEDTGLLLTKGSSFFTQMHYTTSGRAATDQSRIGLYFSDTPPKHVLRHFSIVNPFMRIPPMVAAHKETAYFQPDRDIVVYSLFPHAHYRGRSSEFRLRHPDGREEVLLSIPKYDFNWQRYFQLKEPLEIPAGSMLLHTTVFDNSPQSRTNPDPEASVRFGLQSWEEMLYGGVSYRYKEGGIENPETEETQFQADIFIGSMDKNLDGKLEVSELPERLQQRFGVFFQFVDANQNNGLENKELKNMFDLMEQQQRRARERQQAQ